MMKRRWLVMSVMVLSLVVALPASTQTKDVLTNGDFEIDLTGWSVYLGLGTLAHTTTTTHGGSAGAVQITTATSGATMIQCVDISGELADWPLDGGQRYVTASGYMMSADPGTTARMRMAFYSDTACGNFLSGINDAGSTSTAWTLHTVTGAIPATAQSFYMMAQNITGGGTVVYADDLAAYSSTMTAVQSQGMAASNGLWPAVGMAGVAVLGSVVSLVRRRKAS